MAKTHTIDEDGFELAGSDSAATSAFGGKRKRVQTALGKASAAQKMPPRRPSNHYTNLAVEAVDEEEGDADDGGGETEVLMLQILIHTHIPYSSLRSYILSISTGVSHYLVLVILSQRFLFPQLSIHTTEV
jgi:hypothetical protein